MRRWTFIKSTRVAAMSTKKSNTPSQFTAQRAQCYGEKDVWGIFTPLANKFQAVNLGQGFPNIPAPAFVKDAAINAINQDLNQYAPSKGLPRLRSILAEVYGRDRGRSLDPENEILITQGANQGIALSMQAFINPGEEVVLIEPYFDIYKPSIQVAGGIPIFTTLNPPKNLLSHSSAADWRLDFQHLESIITPNTKAILFNNPHNPTGKVFSVEEMQSIADIAKKHNLLILSDEVYDRLVYEEGEFKSIATLPDMWERTVTFGSGGKTFGVTGWRVGWAIGPANLIKAMLAIHARTVFTTPTPLQDAVASGFDHALTSDYFSQNSNDLIRRRDILLECFKELKLPVVVPQGSYFFLVDTSNINVDLKYLWSEETTQKVKETRDYALCRWMTENIGVTAIPPSAFYEQKSKKLAKDYIRICFCKNDDTLTEAVKRLQKLKEFIK